MMDAIDEFNQRAIGVITSAKVAEALKVEKEDEKVRERYGLRRGDGENSRFLLARRLIETGARVVSFSWGGWDTHGDNFNALRRMLPKLDVGLTAPDRGPRPARHAPGHGRGHVGRVRPHAAHQHHRGPRSLGTGQRRVRRRRRHEDGPGDRLDQPLRRSSAGSAGPPARGVCHVLSPAWHRSQRPRRSWTTTAVRSIWSTTRSRLRSWWASSVTAKTPDGAFAAQKPPNLWHLWRPSPFLMQIPCMLFALVYLAG